MSFFKKGKVQEEALNILMEYDPNLNTDIARGFILGLTSRNPQTTPVVNHIIKMGKKIGSPNGEIAMSVLSMVAEMALPDGEDNLDPQVKSILSATREVTAEWREISKQFM